MFSVTESTGYGTMVDICLGMVGSGKEDKRETLLLFRGVLCFIDDRNGFCKTVQIVVF